MRENTAGATPSNSVKDDSSGCFSWGSLGLAARDRVGIELCIQLPEELAEVCGKIWFCNFS